jgi:hypothetical protein
MALEEKAERGDGVKGRRGVRHGGCRVIKT